MNLEVNMTRTEIINSLIKRFLYKTYLEIGTQNGTNYSQINCKNKVGVDPEPIRIFPGIVKMTSDEFFKNNKKNYDIIMIDGLHHADQVYRDIINSLRYLNYGGTIVCHDMNPSNKEMQEVPRRVKVWTGDSWKAWVNLRLRNAEKFKDVEKFVINTDFGVGIIKPKERIVIYDDKKIKDFSYEYLERYRKELLNLITVQEFKNWIGC